MARGNALSLVALLLGYFKKVFVNIILILTLVILSFVTKLGLTIFRRDTTRRVTWLDVASGIYDEDWRRVYTLFGFIKFDFSFKDSNELGKPDALKVQVGGFIKK